MGLSIVCRAIVCREAKKRGYSELPLNSITVAVALITGQFAYAVTIAGVLWGLALVMPRKRKRKRKRVSMLD